MVENTLLETVRGLGFNHSGVSNLMNDAKLAEPLETECCEVANEMLDELELSPLTIGQLHALIRKAVGTGMRKGIRLVLAG